MSLTPPLSTPLTDLSWVLMPAYQVAPPDSLCAKIQLKYVDCIEAYGVRKGKEKCAELFFDLCECNNAKFQEKRYLTIQSERMKQYRAGKIKKPFEEHPPLDSFLYMT